MALSAGTILEVRTTGSDSNCSGGFNPTNTNMATDGAATVATGASPVFSSASYTFVSGDVGHWVYIKSGTNWTPGWYQIASVAAGSATLVGTIGSAVIAAGVPSTVVGCATVASPSSATWTVDYSQSDSARLTFTDMVIDGTTNTKFTSVANPVGKNFVGNLIKVTSGTNWTVQTVEVVSTATTTATCDKSLGTLSSTGGNGKMGGALVSPGLAASLMVAGMDMSVKAGTYSIDLTATVNTSGARLNISLGVSAHPTRIIGYTAIRGDINTCPVLQVATGAAQYVVTSSGSNGNIENLIVDANGKTANGFNVSGGGRMFRCGVMGGAATGILSSYCEECFATGCTSSAFNSVPTLLNCVAYANTCTGFLSPTVAVGCIAYGNTGGSSDGFQGATIICSRCTSYGNGRNGFFVSTATGSNMFASCVAYGNTAYGFGVTGVAGSMGTRLRSCAGGNNTSGNYADATVLTATDFKTLSANPFTNAASGDFSLNNTAGGGALLRAAAAPALFPGGLTTGYGDIGAVQHQDAGGSGSGVFLLME